MPLKYVFDNPVVVETVGPAHGFLYMIYLVAAFDLSRRADWPLKRMLLVMLAGTVPFVSFYAERRVTAWLDRPAAPYAGAGRRLTGGSTRLPPAGPSPVGVGPARGGVSGWAATGRPRRAGRRSRRTG